MLKININVSDIMYLFYTASAIVGVYLAIRRKV